MTTKELDALERQARAIVDWYKQATATRCITCHAMIPNDYEPTPLCNLCAQTYVADTSPEILALVARISELEKELKSAGAAFLR